MKVQALILVGWELFYFIFMEVTMYNKVSTGMNFVEREKEVEKFWKDKDIFRKSIKLREGAQTYMF